MKNNLFCCIVPIAIGILFLSSCGGDYSPKPRGYYRIDFPEKKYTHYSSECNYEFDYPVYAEIWPDSSQNTKPCWNNIAFPTLNGKIHLSYYRITSEKMFGELIEDSRRLAF